MGGWERPRYEGQADEPSATKFTERARSLILLSDTGRFPITRPFRFLSPPPPLAISKLRAIARAFYRTLVGIFLQRVEMDTKILSDKTWK